MHIHRHMCIFPLPPTISKGGSFPFRTTQRSVPCEMDSGSVPRDQAAWYLGSPICKMKVAVFAASQERCESAPAAATSQEEKCPPRAFAERSPMQRIILGAVFSGRAVLLLVCAIVSMLGVLCPFSRATGLGDFRTKSARKRRAPSAPPAARCSAPQLGPLGRGSAAQLWRASSLRNTAVREGSTELKLG